MRTKTVRVIFVMMIIMYFMAGVAWAGDVNKKGQIQDLEEKVSNLQDQIDEINYPDYSGSWDVLEVAYDAACDETGQTPFTLGIVHEDGFLTVIPPNSPSPTPVELDGNSVAIDSVEGNNSLHARIIFQSGNAFIMAMAEVWNDGLCFKEAILIGSKIAQ